MKILHIIDSLSSGGAEKLISELVPLLNKHFETHVLLLTDKQDFFLEPLKRENINILCVPFRKIYSPLNIFFIRKFIRKGQYTVVHSHLFPANYWTAMASKLIYKNKPKFITTEHSTHNKRREKFYFKLIEKFVYGCYNSVISISESTRQNLIDWLKPMNKNKFIVIENGICLEVFINAERYIKSDLDKRFSERTKLLCMVGSFSKQKDQATVIQAMKYLPKNVHLLLVGKGKLKHEHEKLAKEAEVDDKIEFLGARKDVPRILKTSDIVIVSSHWEGFGLVAAEGMAAGKPVIASDVPGLSEVVRGAGVFFEKCNARDLSHIILELLNNKVKYKKIADECLEKSNNYNIDRMVKDYMKVYNQK